MVAMTTNFFIQFTSRPSQRDSSLREEGSVGVPRLELGTSSLSAKRSNRLSYTPSSLAGLK